MPNYEILITSAVTVFVSGAKNGKEASELALEQWGHEWDGLEIRKLKASEVDASRRHADYKSEPEK